MNVIANTTVISNLATVGRLDLLRDLLGRVYISTDSGTLGVLVQAIKTELLPLDEANSLLKQMIQTGYRSSYNNLAELL